MPCWLVRFRMFIGLLMLGLLLGFYDLWGCVLFCWGGLLLLVFVVCDSLRLGGFELFGVLYVCVILWSGLLVFLCGLMVIWLLSCVLFTLYKV